MIKIVRRERPNPYLIADALQRLDRHVDAFTVAARQYVRSMPRPAQLVHDAYRSLAAITVVLPPLRRALNQYDALDAPLSSKELGLRAINLVVMELAPTAVQLARAEGALSDSIVGFQRTLYSLQQETKRITKIWMPHRRALSDASCGSQHKHAYQKATATAWDAWKRLRASDARDTALRRTLARTASPTLRDACSSILKALYVTAFDTRDDDIRDLTECAILGNARWQ